MNDLVFSELLRVTVDIGQVNQGTKQYNFVHYCTTSTCGKSRASAFNTMRIV